MVRQAKKTQFVKEFHEIDKETFKICEAVKLGLDKFFLEKKQAGEDYGSAHGLRKKDHSDLAEGMDAAKALMGLLQELRNNENDVSFM